MQIDDATERAMFLIGVGKLPGVAMCIAADEYGLYREEVAAACALRGAGYRLEERERDGTWTKESCKKFLIRNLSPREWVSRRARQLVAWTFFHTMTTKRGERDILNTWFDWIDLNGDITNDEISVAKDELFRLWSFLPLAYDPRPITRHDQPINDWETRDPFRRWIGGR
jgi:hypothetical protein